MDEDVLLHSSEIKLNGEVFEIKVFSTSRGRFFARTCLGKDDVIITDGASPPEALQKHEELLPLALGSREITQCYLGFSRRRPRRL